MRLPRSGPPTPSQRSVANERIHASSLAPAVLHGIELTAQLQASPNTIAGYRDTFRLLLRYASERRNRPPTKLRIDDIDAALIGDFLTHVEKVRRNSARSRNTRLAAIRSFYRYVAMNEPEHALHCQRILAMPNKRYARRAVDFIDRTEMEVLLSAPDRSTWIGRRDRAILLLALQTGLRVATIDQS